MKRKVYKVLPVLVVSIIFGINILKAQNPDLPNVPFWKKKADTWDVSVNDAKKSRCGNCAVFNVSVEIRDCIANGIGNIFVVFVSRTRNMQRHDFDFV